jgi:tagatose-1,6-bisphosphate aldolase non-catalytic subunit AgaZ/GatZ
VYREAIYALDRLRDPTGGLQAVMEKVMQTDPAEWQGHYSGDATALYQQRHFGLADRIRYYWPHADAQAAVTTELFEYDTRCKLIQSFQCRHSGTR